MSTTLAPADIARRMSGLLDSVRVTVRVDDPLLRALVLVPGLASLPPVRGAVRVRPSLRAWREAWSCIADDVTALLTEREAAAVDRESADDAHLAERAWSYHRARIDALLAARLRRTA